VPAPGIKIKVGAAVDRNIGDAFKPIVDAARAARQEVEREMDRAWAAVRGDNANVSKGGQGPYRSVVRSAEKAADAIVKTERDKQRKIEQEERRALRRKESAERHVARIKDRHFASEQRQSEREERSSRKETVGRARAIGSGSVETLGRIGSGALGIAGSIARGAGVQTDLGASVGKSVALEARATDLSNAAYDPTSNEGRRDPKSIVARARSVGNMAGFDPEKVIEGLQAFVGKTGDLKTGEAALEDMARLARATGTSLEDMVGAAGEASLALGDVGPGKAFETNAQKAQALSDVLRVLAGQGKIGAIEMKDLAQYGGRLAAASRQFGGDPKKNMADMGALAQISKQEGGGAINAAEASMAVSGLVNTLKTPARVKEFRAQGVETQDADQNFLSVREILKNAASAAGGNTTKFKKMFANVQGGKAADPANTAYRAAFNKEMAATKNKKSADMAGRSAIDAMFNKFSNGIGEKEEKGSFDARMNTTEAKVQLFNNKLGEIGAKIAERVLPEMERFAPAILRAADALAGLIGFAAENPGTAIVAAIVASIGKAAIGQAAGTAISKLIEGAAGKGGFAFGTAAITIAAATLIVSAMNEEKKEGADSVKTDVTATEKTLSDAEKKFKATGTLSAEDMQALSNARITVAANVAERDKFQAAGGSQRYFGDGIAGSIAGGARQAFDVATSDQTFDSIGKGAAAEDLSRQLSLQKQGLDALLAAVQAQAKQTQKVEITNLPGAPGPTANTTNTTK
jgi:hypothetical protein